MRSLGSVAVAPGLKDQFGPEYDRTVQDNDSRRKGERELHERTARHEKLEIVPLSANEIERYRVEWRMVQERFVDAPAESVAMAHALLTAAMSDRGYPHGDQDERAALLSVDNADVVDQYRQGAAIERQWRELMVSRPRICARRCSTIAPCSDASSLPRVQQIPIGATTTRRLVAPLRSLQFEVAAARNPEQLGGDLVVGRARRGAISADPAVMI